MTDYQANYVRHHLLNALQGYRGNVMIAPPGGDREGHGVVAFATIPPTISDEEWQQRFDRFDIVRTEGDNSRKVVMVYHWYTAELKEMIETYWQTPVTEQTQ